MPPTPSHKKKKNAIKRSIRRTCTSTKVPHRNEYIFFPLPPVLSPPSTVYLSRDIHCISKRSKCNENKVPQTSGLLLRRSKVIPLVVARLCHRCFKKGTLTLVASVRQGAETMYHSLQAKLLRGSKVIKLKVRLRRQICDEEKARYEIYTDIPEQRRLRSKYFLRRRLRPVVPEIHGPLPTLSILDPEQRDRYYLSLIHI